MAFYETVCCWLLFRIPCPVCYLYVSTICMCVWVGYQRPSKIICSQKGSTLFQWGVDITMHITKKELALHSHCKRRTRGVEETTRLIKDLIDTFSSDKGKDTMGIPLLKKTSIQQNWEEQKQHISSIQDVDDPAIQLYTQTGTLKKGGVELPMYRYAWGSTSLESFHLHIDRFIPGKKHTKSFTYKTIMSSSSLRITSVNKKCWLKRYEEMCKVHSNYYLCFWKDCTETESCVI